VLRLSEAFSACREQPEELTKTLSEDQRETMNITRKKIALGITEDQVELGSHLIHFWRTQEEFERGVRFLELGMADQTQYCVVFGHDEANRRVLEILRSKGHDVDRMLREGRLVILRRESSAPVTLENIEAAFSAAVHKGATAIRYLGNLGMDQAPLPGRGAEEVVELEKGATLLALRYPCVNVCVYDVNTVSGGLLLNAGFGTHSHAVSRGALRPNSYYVAEEDSRPVFCKR
jgi:MEDS: MEthanogen/methylotroph, DcmR Sensory domain